MAETKDEWRARHHATFGSTPEVVDDLVLQACGVRPETRERLLVGEVNEVIAVRAGSHELIVRIFHGAGGRFLREHAAIECCRRSGIPVPEVLLVEASRCVERCLPGSALSELALGLEPAALESLGRAAGRLLGQLATTDAQELEPVLFTSDDWAGSLQERVRRLLLDPELLTQAALDANDLCRIESHLLDAAAEFDALPRGVCHGDYHPKHLLSDGQVITGLIDLESSGAGPVVYDVAWWDYFEPPAFPTSVLLAGLAEVAPVLVPSDRQIHLARLRLAPQLLQYFAPQARLGGVDFVMRRLREDLLHLGLA